MYEVGRQRVEQEGKLVDKRELSVRSSLKFKTVRFSLSWAKKA